MAATSSRPQGLQGAGRQEQGEPLGQTTGAGLIWRNTQALHDTIDRLSSQRRQSTHRRDRLQQPFGPARVRP